VSDGNASASAREGRCGYTTNEGDPCELPASRRDGCCHLHTDLNERTPDDDASRADDYDAMLQTLDVAIEAAREKIESGRIRDEDKEKIRIKWVRALAYSLNVRRQIAADRDLEELTERLEQLEEHSGVEM